MGIVLEPTSFNERPPDVGAFDHEAEIRVRLEDAVLKHNIGTGSDESTVVEGMGKVDLPERRGRDWRVEDDQAELVVCQHRPVDAVVDAKRKRHAAVEVIGPHIL